MVLLGRVELTDLYAQRVRLRRKQAVVHDSAGVRALGDDVQSGIDAAADDLSVVRDVSFECGGGDVSTRVVAFDVARGGVEEVTVERAGADADAV